MEKLPSASLLKEILVNYFREIEGILGVAICDRNGFIIASESKQENEEESDEIIGALSAMLDSYIDRIKTEFGTSNSFFNITETGNKKLVFCSMGPNSILTTVAEQTTTDIELKVYSEHIASKVELVLSTNEDVSPKIPEIIKALSKTRGGQLPNMTGEYSNKLILCGDNQVGKTSLIRRYVENKFERDYISTLGVQISKKIVFLSEKTKLNFIIWDIGGQVQQMAPYRAKFYNGANAAFIVVDRTRQGTLNSIEKWYQDIKKSVPRNIPIVIVGNKSDLVDEIVISEEELKEVAIQFGFHYIVTSALTGENCNDAFLYIAYRVIESL
ncbi:MAG: GTP-binding protein [Candidatus Lokiarchaeota archaeon]|nr:GTP-binding protein [Candidatus Lokiarchaeota archaeon]